MIKKRYISILLAVMLIIAFPATVYGSSSPKIQKIKPFVFVGESIRLKLTNADSNTKIQWSSDNKSVVVINKKGLITGISAGKTQVHAKYKGKVYDSTVTVTTPWTKNNLSSLIVETNTRGMSKEEVKKLIDTSIANITIYRSYSSTTANPWTKEQLETMMVEQFKKLSSQQTPGEPTGDPTPSLTTTQVSEMIASALDDFHCSCSTGNPWTKELLESMMAEQFEKLHPEQHVASLTSEQVSEMINNAIADVQVVNNYPTTYIYQDATPKEASDIIITPSKSCVYKNAKYSKHLTHESHPLDKFLDVSIDAIQVPTIETNSYEAFLSAEDRSDSAFSSLYYKYSIPVNFSGHVDSSYAGKYIRFRFSQVQNDSEVCAEQFSRIQADGTFSDSYVISSNFIPSTITLVCVDLCEKMS